MTLSSENQQADQGNGPAPDLHRENPLIRAVKESVVELQTARTYIERDLKEGRDDMKTVLQSLARLDEKVGSLPTKTWIGVAIAGVVAMMGTLVTVVYKLATGH